MFRKQATDSPLEALAGVFVVVHAVTVRKIRKSHGNAVLALFLSVTQTLMLVAVFYVMFTVIGIRGAQIRGDFVLFLMSGIFLYMTFNAAMGAVMSADGPTSPMMLHAPMTTMVAILGSALAALYIQLLSLALVLGIYQLGWHRVEIADPLGAVSMLLLSWFSGTCAGLVFAGLRPWAPFAVGLVHQVYSRANVIASGKMFLANTMPGYILVWFDWNPLFHTIDQARGFAFANYNPHYSSVLYPVAVSLAMMVIGLMAEYVARRKASLSWSAGT
ncbi:ABC transporter permease [Poseidonocella sp. HB161398]|uniref:ABC transporter permease n=1 Tax=Poseidonocella sp. HB161398 TaxID=2320855 RepID=UPI001108A023|nr:ABC transporter permease [Poseidonocella sp. HB161398]